MRSIRCWLTDDEEDGRIAARENKKPRDAREEPELGYFAGLGPERISEARDDGEEQAGDDDRQNREGAGIGEGSQVGAADIAGGVRCGHGPPQHTSIRPAPPRP
ncbi:MAG: hypothetical protein HUU21_07205 [Polyangiaceae bacterium]|nr:hypothetical protein [Polyangiaceae bacterium]